MKSQPLAALRWIKSTLSLLTKTIRTMSLAAATAPALLSAEVLFTSGDGYHTYRIPAIVCAPSGTLIAFAEGRESVLDHGNIDIVARRSEDNGKTWGKQFVVRNNGGHQAGNPCPLVNEVTGQIMLFFCESDHSEGDVKRGIGSREVNMMVSDDEGVTWSEPRNISKMTKEEGWRWYATGPCSAIQLKTGPNKGRLVVPANHSIHNFNPEKPNAWRSLSHSLWSDDQGETWQIGQATKKQGNESTIAELGPDYVIQDMRMRPKVKMRAVRYSRDGGETWSEMTFDPSRPDPRCQGSIIAVENERAEVNRLYFSNSSHPEKRVNLSVFTSTDAGKSWEKIATLTEHFNAYSDLVETKDGRIACLYEAGVAHSYETIAFQFVK